MGLKQEIKDFAKEIGIDLLGFAAATPFLKEENILRKREFRGLISPFEEQDLELRCYPEKILPGAKTIICAGMGYLIDPYNPLETKPELAVTGKFSRYALIKDYHHVLSDKLNSLVEFISRKKKGRFKIAVDTGALLEKAAAQRAGIGWIGENTCFFTSEFGSWVFLGEILTDIDIKPDIPAKNLCTSCGQCIRSCPTGALMAPFQINPYRCLSYITQMRGSIPEEFRNALGNRIFGCDTCQEACPKNFDVTIPGHREFIPDLPLEQDIIKLTQMTKKDFNTMFRNTAAGWRGRNVIRRNAVCALGNIKKESHVKYLKKLLEDPSEIIREQALWSLRNFN